MYMCRDIYMCVHIYILYTQVYVYIYIYIYAYVHITHIKQSTDLCPATLGEDALLVLSLLLSLLLL